MLWSVVLSLRSSRAVVDSAQDRHKLGYVGFSGMEEQVRRLPSY